MEILNIIFRGKRIDNGEWVFGYYIKKKASFSTDIDTNVIVTFDENAMSVWNKVDPITVCQYTGLTDKNGTKIFEGDIISIPGTKKPGLPAAVTYWADAVFAIQRNGYCRISLEDSDDWAEVIGNIYDNPELLK